MDSLPLFHSWPLYDAPTRLGVRTAGFETAEGGALDALATPEIGIWACDLATETLSWSPAVHALFGLPQNERVTRPFAVSRYVKHSRMAMEIMRAYAIEHRRGFTLDAMIVRADGDKRWMRLCGMPVVAGGKVVRLTGTKQDVTVEYDGPGWQDL